MRVQCGGGLTRPCPTEATWRVRENRPEYDSNPYADRAWSYACGRHLHFTADEITGGERMVLIVERIRADE